MKRYPFFLAVIICALASCVQEDDPKIVGNKLVPATIVAESSGFGTRSTATWNNGVSRYNIKWETNDELSVFTDADTENHKFTAIQSARFAEFTGELPGSAVTLYPIMPYDKDARISGTDVYTSIPAEQDGDFYNVVLAGWPRPDTETRAGGEDFFYQFEAVSGIIKFHFDHTKIADFGDDPQHVIRLSISADRPIAGDAKISFTGGKPVMTADPNGTGTNMRNTISITAPDGATSLPDGDYYIATLPINKANLPDSMGISVKCETIEGKVAYIRTTIGGTGYEHILTANVVKNIGTVKTTDYVLNNGEFTVQVVSGSPKKVRFSPGNLQYLASGNDGNGLFRFAPNQYDAIGEVGNLTSPASMDDDGIRATQSEWIDLFPFGHSGWTYNSITYEPYRAKARANSYYANNITENSNLVGSYANGDWGVYNSILNGNVVNEPGTWRLLTFAEFELMCNMDGNGYRNKYVNEVSIKAAGATQKQRYYYLRCGIRTGVFEGGNEIIRYGMLLFPDFFEWPVDELELPTIAKWPYLLFNYKYCSNEDAPKYTLSEFSILEREGVVFLPCAGQRTPADQNTQNVSFKEGSYPFNNQSSFNIEGHYWTSSRGGAIVTRPENVLLQENSGAYLAKSVRLVKNGTGF